MSDHAHLIERLEKASGPDGMLDDELAKIAGWTFTKMKGDARPYWREPGETAYYMRRSRPSFTRSIDAALTLIPKGWNRSVDATAPECGIDVELHPLNPAFRLTGTHANEAIATCIAALKARASLHIHKHGGEE